MLALREGPLLEAAVRALDERPDVLLVNATGRDHPRRAGLAVQLGTLLELPTIGVSHRPLLATGLLGPHPRRTAPARRPRRLAHEDAGAASARTTNRSPRPRGRT